MSSPSQIRDRGYRACAKYFKQLPDGDFAVLLIVPGPKRGQLKWRTSAVPLRRQLVILKAFQKASKYPDKRVAELIQRLQQAWKLQQQEQTCSGRLHWFLRDTVGSFLSTAQLVLASLV
jgi:hypothetical protein